MTPSVLAATGFIFASPEDHVRHPLWLANGPKAGQMQCAVDYGAGAAWEVEQFWPRVDSDLQGSDMMDQNILVQGVSIYMRDGVQVKGPVLLVDAENQYRRNGNSDAVDTGTTYSNCVFCPAVLELGQHVYESDGTVTWRKYATFSDPSNPARTVFGQCRYRVTITVSVGAAGGINVELLEEFWQAMQDTDPDGYKNGWDASKPWGYRRAQRYEQGSGLVFLHDLQAGWIAARYQAAKNLMAAA